MSTGHTAQRAPGAKEREALCCQWERTAYGALTARWRFIDAGIPPSEAQAVRAQRRADRRRLSSRRRRATAGLSAAAAIASLYFVTWFAVVAAFVARDSAVW